MRVLHFYKTSFPESMGGVEQVIHQLARGTAQLGIHTDVLSLTTHSSSLVEEIDGYRVYRVPMNFQIASTGFSIKALSQFANLAQKADVIHYHFPWPFMDLVHFLTRVKKPSVLTYHSDIVRQKYWLKLYRPLRNLFLNAVDKIVATSPNYLATSHVLAQYPDKTVVIPIGLDQTTYPEPSAEKLRYWQEKLGPKFFLFIGVLRYYKGLHILLKAIQGLSYPVVIVGAGPIEKSLKQQAHKLNLQNVHFLGSVPDDDKVALLKLCYGVVFPSHLRSEAFGVSLLEGAMYGKPLISSEIGTGTSYINIHNETGLVVQPADPDALHHAMRYLWTHPEKANLMGQRAQERYHQYFTAHQMVQSYVELYASLIKN